MDEAKQRMPTVSNALTLPCLGRPFQLGMLYDCRDDRLIPGVTLWDGSTLQKALDSRPQAGVQFSIIAEDTIDNKTASLGVEAGLKLSLLGGLVKVSGSAKFLDNQKSSKKQARVSLMYSMTSHFEQLTMHHLAVDNVQYPDVFEKGDATHVVTAALYGAEAFFVFDREISGNETFRDIHGRMAVMIKKLPSISIEGDGKLDMKDTEICEVDKFQCEFHGDIVLPENPTTFQEAVKVYKQLPQLIRGDDTGAKVVPKRVWLYPLCQLDSKAAQLVREISIGLVTQTQKLIENLQDLRMRATDLKKCEVYTYFPGIEKQLSHFAEMISEYEMDIAKRVSIILPQIRGGGAEETKLAEVFTRNLASPFSYRSLSSWLQGKEQEQKMLQTYLVGLQCDGVQLAFCPGELDAVVTDLDIDQVLCFAFKVAGSRNPFLEVMYDYLHTSQECTAAISKHWYQDRKTTNDMKTKAKAFKSFAQANSSNKGMRFVVTDISEEEDGTNSGADILLYTSGMSESYEPPSQPGKPKASSVTHESIQLMWSKPEYGAQNVESYTVLYRQEGNPSEQWVECVANGESSTVTLGNLESQTAYHFKVRAVCEVGVSLDSEESDPIPTEPSPYNRLAVIFKSISTPIKQGETDIAVYKLPLTLVAEDRMQGLVKCCIDNPANLLPHCSEKVLMCIGATGSGKSTLINGMANYILGVQWKDDFRFKMICDEVDKSQAHSQTQLITSYSFPKFEGSPLQYQLTVIDTPGFGDTRGLERDEQITAQIKYFFTTRSTLGIDHLDGIGFVSKSPDGRLTPTQKYIIDSILAVFGKDIGDNIFVMTTFSDGAYPPVMGAITTHIRESNPPIPIVANNLRFFKFNNSALYSKPRQTTALAKGGKSFDETYWEVGYSSFHDFFHHLGNAQPCTLSLTRDVLDERERLQTIVQGIQQDIRKSMNSIDEMRQEKHVLEENEAKIRANKNFTYQKTETHTAKETIEAGTFITNCLKCNRTCHYPCSIPPNYTKEGCAAIDCTTGYCRICPGQCYWDPHHVNNDFRYVDVVETVTRHYADLEQKYRDAEKGKATAESMIAKIRQKVKDTFDNICESIKRAQECIVRLEEIALKPNPLTEVEYIDLMIESEKSARKANWEQRVQCYEKAKEFAQTLAKAREGELPPSIRDALADDLLKDISIKKEPKKSMLGAVAGAVTGAVRSLW